MASSPLETPSHRACAHCRSQKVRCIPVDTSPETCQRCAKSGRLCVSTPLQMRKHRKRTDTRVTELEREMRAMRSALKHKEEAAVALSKSLDNSGNRDLATDLWCKDSQPDAPRSNQTTDWVGDNDTDEVATRSERAYQISPPSVPALWPVNYANGPAQTTKDVVDSGKIQMATARKLFETYKRDLFPHYPMVVVPQAMTADEMRCKQPVLFLAIIAAAAGKDNPELSAALDQEVLQAYATHSLMQSEKSLELVQALLISSVWYHPPKKFGQLKYYEYIHMAATMAMEIGIGSRQTVNRNQNLSKQDPKRAAIHPAEDVRNPDLSMTPRSQENDRDTSSLESRRTFLACYFICAGVSMSLRRPNMLRVSSYIKDCVDFLDQAPDAIPTDRIIVAWVRLIIIGEEISVSFCYDDAEGIASIREIRTQLMLKDFEKRLSAWYRSFPEADMGSGALAIMYYTVRLYLHEIALHIDHAPEDFRAPYHMGIIHPYPEADQIPTQILAEAITECISSSHALLEVFLYMNVESLRAIPVFSYVRVSFAAFVLAKLCLSTSHPESRIGHILDRSSLKVEHYMDRLIIHVRNIVGRSRCRIPAIFLALLFKLRQWCLDPNSIVEANRELFGDSMQQKQSLRAKQSGIRESDYDEGSNGTINSQRVVDERYPNNRSKLPEMPKFDELDLSIHKQIGASCSAEGSLAYPYCDGEVVDALYDPHSDATMPNTATLTTELYTSSLGVMELDSSCLQVLDEMNAFTEGGLTGLDDWATQPLDLLEQREILDGCRYIAPHQD